MLYVRVGHSISQIMRHWTCWVLVIALVGCASPEPKSPQTASNLPEVPDAREEGLLLLMADRRFYDSFTVGTIRLDNPELGVPLANALGRIGDSRGLPMLQTLLVEGRPEVRREAAFALGMIDDPEPTAWSPSGAKPSPIALP